MTDKTHPNYVEHYTPTPDDLRAMFARTAEQAAAQKAARDHAEQWPSRVERTLHTLANGIVTLRERLDALEAKLGAVQG